MTDAPAVDLRQLQYFITAAERGSIAAAAKSLGIAPATLSEGLSVLEAKIGLALAVRTRRGLLLTPAGQAVLADGRALLAAAQSLVDAAYSAEQEVRGPANVAMPPSLGALIGIPFAETIRTEHPLLKLRSVEGLSGDILDWVAQDRVDIGFVYDLPDPSVYYSRVIFREELCLLAAPDFIPEQARKGPPLEIDIGLLAELPLVLPGTRHNLRGYLETIARDGRFQLNIVSEIDSYTQILEMVSRASAYTVQPRSAVLAQLERGEFSVIGFTGISCWRSCYLVRARNRLPRPADLAIETTITQLIAEMNRRHNLAMAFAAPEAEET